MESLVQKEHYKNCPGCGSPEFTNKVKIKANFGGLLGSSLKTKGLTVYHCRDCGAFGEVETAKVVTST